MTQEPPPLAVCPRLRVEVARRVIIEMRMAQRTRGHGSREAMLCEEAIKEIERVLAELNGAKT